MPRRCVLNPAIVVNIADGIHILDVQFQMATPLGNCDEACDANDDGNSGDVSDAVYVFNYRFLNGPLPPAPFPDCAPLLGAPCTSHANCP